MMFLKRKTKCSFFFCVFFFLPIAQGVGEYTNPLVYSDSPPSYSIAIDPCGAPASTSSSPFIFSCSWLCLLCCACECVCTINWKSLIPFFFYCFFLISSNWKLFSLKKKQKNKKYFFYMYATLIDSLRGNKWVPCRPRVSCYVVWSRKLKIPPTQSDHLPPPSYSNSSAAPLKFSEKKRGK